MAAGDTYQITLVGKCQGQAIVNHHFVRAAAAGDLSVTIANTWNTSLLATWLACHPSDYTLDTIRVRQINPPGPVAYERAPSSSAGTIAPTSGTLTAAVCVKQTSSYIGRSRRGRTFIGPVIETHIKLGVVVSALVGYVNAYFTALNNLWGVGGSDVANAQWVIWSNTIAHAISQNPPPAMGSPNSASAYVVAYHTDPTARVLRRRELGVGS